VSDKPDKSKDSDDDEPLEEASFWPQADSGPIPEADIEPEPLYEPEIPPDMHPDEVLDEAQLLGEAGDLEFQTAEPEPEPLPLEMESDLKITPKTQRPAQRDEAAARQRVKSKRKVRTRSQRELGQVWGGIFFAVNATAPRVVAVTSALRQEGVTQIATALAMSGVSSHADQRIALVDCNFRHPRIADLLGIEAAPGLSDVLNARVSLDRALHSVSIVDSDRDLTVLTAGAEEPQPLGLFRSRQFKSVLGTLRERFDHVILDMPATNLYPDPQVIGSCADGVVIVVHSSRTRRESVAEAKKRLELAQAKLIGVVLNQRTYPIPGFLYRSF